MHSFTENQSSYSDSKRSPPCLLNSGAHLEVDSPSNWHPVVKDPRLQEAHNSLIAPHPISKGYSDSVQRTASSSCSLALFGSMLP